jgi:hypothetical protein
MNDPYSVSHIYDETGGAAARYHEFLRATGARHRAIDARGRNQGPSSRILSSAVGTLTDLNSRLGVRRGINVKVSVLND